MRHKWQLTLFLLLSLSLLLNMTACDLLKKKVPPNELFRDAENHRKNDNMLEAANAYDDLIKQHAKSELAPAALYYSGICKYTLSIRSPGRKEFEQRQGGLSETKKDLYTQWIKYMEKHNNDFFYAEALDKFLYQGNEFRTLIEQHPSSNLVDDAAFQFTRTQILEKRSKEILTVTSALQLYAEYFTKYPQSPYRQKGIEHLLQLIAEYAETMLNHEEIVTAYQELARVAENMPGVKQLSYLLASKFLEVNDTQNAASILGVTSVLGIGTVQTRQTRLNVRSGQGVEYRIVTKVNKGAQVLLLSKSGQWYNIRLQDGAEGYAHSDFIQEYQ